MGEDRQMHLYRPNPEEVCTIVVNGRNFEDFETIWLQHRYADNSAIFRFTCAERPSSKRLCIFFGWLLKVRFSPDSDHIADISAGPSCANSGRGQMQQHACA